MPRRPLSPGVKLCGVVDEIGKDVDGWHRGDVIPATCSHGGLAEYCVVAAGNAFRLPANKDPAEGAALLLTYATALHALRDRAALKPDETLLVLGAAGGVEIGRAHV